MFDLDSVLCYLLRTDSKTLRSLGSACLFSLSNIYFLKLHYLILSELVRRELSLSLIKLRTAELSWQ